MDESALQVVSEIGLHLGSSDRWNKDILVKSLRQATTALSQIDQPLLPVSSQKLGATKKLEVALKPLRKYILNHALLQHTDKDVKLLVAICITELFRILAPKPPFEDKYLREIFKLLLGIFSELADTTSPYFSKRVKILETVARCKCCVIMLDIDCSDLVLEIFNVFFSVVREHHQRSLINDILSIVTHILSEEASQPLLDVILRNLAVEGKDATSAAPQLAVSVIQNCAETLEPFVCGFLTSCSLDRDSCESELKEFYHEILFKIFQCAPQMLLAVIPNLIQELLTDQVDVRIKAVKLIGKLLALPESHIAQNYRNLFIEFKNRFSDKSVEVRLSAIRCAKACYISNPRGKESLELLASLEGRLLDFDDKVRTLAVDVVCNVARSNLKIFPLELISKTTERLRDKKISVRKKALQKLTEVYQEYCMRCSEGHMTMSDHFEEIPCKVLMLCCEKDSKEFRFQNMEVILAEDLFPDNLSVKERTRHWIHFFSLFTPLHVKALNSILSLKRRLQMEMQAYLALRKKQKEASSEEVQERLKRLFVKMSACFPDPPKAEECFHKLSHMKDNRIFNELELLLNQRTFFKAQTTRDKFLKMIGDSHQHFEFLKLLSAKCSFNIFSSEHVHCILENLSDNGLRNEHLEASSAKLLMAIINVFPALLGGSEELLRELIEEKDSINYILVEALAKAGPYISVKISNFYPLLERLCLEGTRIQSKFAVSAIASLADSSKEPILSNLCEELVDSLHCGRNIPTVLQSLGCIGQHCISVFETHYDEISSFALKTIFQVEQNDHPTLSDENSGCSDSCKLKIFALKMLVKSFLPHLGSHVQRQIDHLLDILSKMILDGGSFDGIISCASEKPHVRLAAAKSLLRLSRRWDLHISPEIFHLIISVAKDSCSFVRRLFLDKAHKLLKERAIPIRYACAFALAQCDDLQDASVKHLEEFIKDCSREAQVHKASTMQGGSLTDFPSYIVVFLIHILAHDADFPPLECQDEQVYAQFCGPLFRVIQALLNSTIFNGDMDLINDTALHLHSIFRAIKRAEDAVDAQETPKLQILAEIGSYIVNSLNQNSNSSLCAPGVILLPSSLYRINPKKCSEASLKFLTPFLADEKFFKGVVHILTSQISLGVSTLPKCTRKSQEDGLKVADCKDGALNLVSPKRVHLSKLVRTEKQKKASREISFGDRRKHASPIASESQGLHTKRSIIERCKNYVPRNSESILQKENISFCDSATTKPPAAAKALTLERICHPLKENIATNSCMTIEACEYSREKLQEKTLCREIVLVEESNTFHSSNCNPASTVSSLPKETFEYLAKKGSRELRNGRLLSPVKQKKRHKVCEDTSLSDIVNVNEETATRRARKQKA